MTMTLIRGTEADRAGKGWLSAACSRRHVMDTGWTGAHGDWREKPATPGWPPAVALGSWAVDERRLKPWKGAPDQHCRTFVSQRKTGGTVDNSDCGATAPAS